MTLHGLAQGAFTVSAILAVVGAVWAFAGSRTVLARSVGRGALLGMLLLLAGHALVVRPWIPDSLWHEFHAADLLSEVEDPPADGWVTRMHGPAYAGILKSLRAASFGGLSVFSVNYGLSLCSALLLFLLVALAAGVRAAWMCALMLLLLPVRLRLSCTESMFVLVEFLSILAGTLAVLSVRTRRAVHLAAAGACLVVLAQVRAEMLLLAPAAALVYLAALRGDLPRAPVRRWVWFATAAGVLLVPRALEVLSLGDPRTGQLAGSAGLWDIGRLGLARTNAFFDPAWTPVILPGLLVAGSVLLFRRRRALFFAVTAHWAGFTHFYAQHLTCPALEARTALATQYILVAIAGWGIHHAASRLGRAGRLAAEGAALALIVLMPVLQRDSIRTLDTQQEEHGLLRSAAEVLPDRAVVVYLSEEDDPQLAVKRAHQGRLLSRAAKARGKRFVLLGIRPFLALAREVKLEGFYFYEGPACRIGGVEPTRADPPGENPLCSRMRSSFEFEPALLSRITDRSFGPLSMRGGSRTMGFHRVAGVRDGAPVRPFVPREGVSFWLSVGLDGTASGREDLARAALRLASEGPGASGGGEIRDRERLFSAAMLYQSLGDLEAARKLIERLLSADPGEARYHAALGTILALRDRPAGAEVGLRRAIELDPGYLPAYATLGSVLSGRGDRGGALDVYDAALRAARRGDPMAGHIRRERAKLK